MVDRHPHLAAPLDGVVFESLVNLGHAHEIVQPAAAPDRVPRELEDRFVSGENVERRLVIADARNPAPTRIVLSCSNRMRLLPNYSLAPAARLRASLFHVHPASTMKFCAVHSRLSSAASHSTIRAMSGG
jgi:hypothetical protein